MAIATVKQVRDFMAGHGLTIPEDMIPVFISARLEATLATLQSMLGREYGVDDEASTRLYDGSGVADLIIDAAQSVTTVELLDSTGDLLVTYDANDWRAFPYNSAPKRIIRLVKSSLAAPYYGGGFIRSWPIGTANIRVTATWGEGTAPADVIEAHILMTALSLLAGENLPTIDGTVAVAAKSISTGVTKIEFAQDRKDEIIGKMTGWSMFIERVISGRRLARPC